MVLTSAEAGIVEPFSACRSLRFRETGIRGQRQRRRNGLPYPIASLQRQSARTQRRQFRGHLPATRKSPVAPECVVADAVGIEPVSAVKFPAFREKNREFLPKSSVFEQLYLQLFERSQRPFAAKFPTRKSGELFWAGQEFEPPAQGMSIDHGPLPIAGSFAAAARSRSRRRLRQRRRYSSETSDGNR